jgi:hypothetical protein
MIVMQHCHTAWQKMKRLTPENLDLLSITIELLSPLNYCQSFSNMMGKDSTIRSVSEIFPWHYQFLFMIFEVRSETNLHALEQLIDFAIAKCDLCISVSHTGVTI